MDKWNTLRDRLTQGIVQAESQNNNIAADVLSQILETMTELDKEKYEKEYRVHREIVRVEVWNHGIQNAQ